MKVHACRYCALVAVVLLHSTAPADAPKTPADMARAVDAALTRGADRAALPTASDDVTFIRRVTIDLTGKLPAADDIAAFVKDTGADKRGRLIEKLLASDAYAVNWGRYWR